MPKGNRVPIWVRKTVGGRVFLTTAPDGIAPNNLDALPHMPNPLADVEPPWLLNIPGIFTVTRLSINSVAHSGSNTLTSLSQTPLTMPVGDRPGEPTKIFEPPTAFWRQTPRWFHLGASAPHTGSDHRQPRHACVEQRPRQRSADLLHRQSAPWPRGTFTLPKGVLLSTSFATPPRGTKRLVIGNQSNRAKPLDI